MKKSIKILAAILAAAALTGCSKKSTGKHTDVNKAASSLASSNVVTQTSNRINYQNYQKIKVVEKTGSTLQDVNRLLGRKADAISKSSNNGLKVKVYTWQGVAGGTAGSNLTVEFAKGVALVKQISGFKVSRQKDITLKDYQKLKKGQSQAAVKTLLGQPNGYSESDYDNKVTILWIYTSGLKSEGRPSLYVTFQNGKLLSKQQSDLE